MHCVLCSEQKYSRYSNLQGKVLFPQLLQLKDSILKACKTWYNQDHNHRTLLAIINVYLLALHLLLCCVFVPHVVPNESSTCSRLAALLWVQHVSSIHQASELYFNSGHMLESFPTGFNESRNKMNVFIKQIWNIYFSLKPLSDWIRHKKGRINS